MSKAQAASNLSHRPRTRAQAKLNGDAGLHQGEDAQIKISAPAHSGFPTTEAEVDALIEHSHDREPTYIRKSSSGLEWPRKLFHSATGFVVMYLWTEHVPIEPILQVLGVGFIILLLAEIGRFNSKRFEILYEKKLGFLMRMSEKRQINGVVYYVLGVMICLTFFPRDIAVISIIILSWCDTSASIFGRLFGRYTPPLPFRGSLFANRKSLAGSSAAIFTGALAGYIFFTKLGPLGSEGDLSWKGTKTDFWTGLLSSPPTRFARLPNPDSHAPVWLMCLITGLSAGLAEAIEIWRLDDNLTMGPLAALLIWTAFKLT